jgi:hypothetical protein
LEDLTVAFDAVSWDRIVPFVIPDPAELRDDRVPEGLCQEELVLVRLEERLKSFSLTVERRLHDCEDVDGLDCREVVYCRLLGREDFVDCDVHCLVFRNVLDVSVKAMRTLFTMREVLEELSVCAVLEVRALLLLTLRREDERAVPLLVLVFVLLVAFPVVLDLNNRVLAQLSHD